VIPEMVCASEGDNPNDTTQTITFFRTMTTHSYTKAGTGLLAAALLLTGLTRKPLEETLQMVAYDADNPDADMDFGVPDGSSTDTLDFDAPVTDQSQTVDFNMIEGRVKVGDGDGLRFENFENFSVSSSNNYDGTTFKLQGTEGTNRFNISSGNGHLYGRGGNDVMTVQAGGSHRIHGGSGTNDVARLEGGNFTLTDVELDSSNGSDGGRWLVFSDGQNETRIHESTEIININNNRSFNEYWDSHRVEINDRRPNSRREHDLEGSFRNEDFHGGRGRDNLTGAEGADHFYLESNHRRAFGDTHADRITDFSKAENDLIKIDANEFGVDIDDEVMVARNSRRADRLLRNEDNAFVYDRSTGSLYFNRNGDGDGSGNGLIAVIQGDDAGSLRKQDFDLF